MTAPSGYRGRSLAWGLARVALLLASLVAGSAAAADVIKVEVDRAVLTKLPAQVSTIVIGNPLIADVTVQPGGLLVITGKGFGMTNMIALDRSGAVIAEHNLEVVGARTGNIVVVYRGLNRESYSCAPDCERRITLGDSAEFFEATIGQATTRAARAAGAAPAQH
jgi:Flp pilus assembly secretin CpaC